MLTGMSVVFPSSDEDNTSVTVSICSPSVQRGGKKSLFNTINLIRDLNNK